MADDGCPAATWKRVPFLPDVTPGFDPTQWSYPQFQEYAKGTLLSATSVNLAFFAIVLAVFLLLLIWRLLGCLCWCCTACCGIRPGMRPRKSLLSFEVMHDPWLRGHKIVYAFFALGCIALAAMGLATLPRGTQLAEDLAVRLDGASAFATALLKAADGLQNAAVDVRPLMSQAATVLQKGLTSPSLSKDLQCTLSLMDSGLSDPASLRRNLSAANDEMRNGVAPALAAASALLNTTAGPTGATAAMAAVAAMPGLISSISRALTTYDNALGAMPATRQPTSTSNPAVTTLQAAQTALNLTQWISNIDTLYDSVRTVSAAAQQQPYTTLAGALSALRVQAANATTVCLSPLSVSLSKLDTLYLGTTLQQQLNASTIGRWCMSRVVQELADFDAAVFRFNGTLERFGLGAVGSVQGSMLQLYGLDAAAAAAAAAAAGRNRTSVVLTPVPTATSVSQAMQLLAPIVAMNDSVLSTQSAAVQNALSYPNGTSRLPDTSQTLSYLTSLRAALVALQSSAGPVATALTAYGTTQTDVSYGALYATANSTRAASATARADASAPLPSTTVTLVAIANTTSTPAGALQSTLGNVLTAVPQTVAWLTTNDLGLTAVARTTSAMTQMQTLFNQSRVLLLQAGYNASSAALPSTMVQPLKQSMQLVSSTISNGIAVITEQLDNALGKVIVSPPPSASHRRTLLQSSNSSSANATELVRQQLVRRLENVVNTLRGHNVHQYSKVSYWVAVGIYAAVITSCVLLGLAAFFNFPAGLLVMLVLQLLLAMVVLAGAWTGAAALVVAHDACGSADSMVLSAVSPSSPLFPLVRFYLQGVGGSLNAVLRTAGLGDTSRLGAAADALQHQLLEPMLLTAPPAGTNTSLSSWPGSLGAVQYELGGVLVDMSAAASAVMSTLGTLLQLSDRTAVLAQYNAITSWGCCGAAAKVFIAWICATGCGLLAWVAAMSGIMLLKNLDDMPVGKRCGCSCFDPKDFPRPQRRQRHRSRSGGGGGYSGSGGYSSGGGATSSGGGAADGLLMMSPAIAPSAPPHPHPPPRSPMVPPGYGVTPNWAHGYSNSSAPPSAAASISASPAKHWQGGKEAGSKEAGAESGLFQGPVSATAAGATLPYGATAPRAQDSSPLRQRPSVRMCVMDPDTAAAFGFGGEDGTAPPAPPRHSPPRYGP